MTQTEDVTGSTPVGEKRFDGVLHPAIAKVAQKGIAGTEWQKS